MNATLARLTRLTAEPQTAPDGALLNAFLAGDQDAFAVLVRRHAGLVFATCRRILRHQQDAEDAFQATFLVLARRAADVWPREAVASWLFGVAHRVALKARATRNRRATREHALEDVAGEASGGPDFDLVEAVHRVICKLPEVYRAAVVACDLEGLSRREAAERLGWSEGTLSGRLARARELLAKRFHRLGLTLPAGGLAVFATPDTAPAAAIQSTIDLATGVAAGAPASVVALTEGVVRSMALFKVKAMTAAILVACALGVGAFAASSGGAGNADGPGTQQFDAPPAAPVAPAPVAAAPVEQPKPLPPAKPATDPDRLQGTWRIVSLTEGGKTTTTDSKDPWVMTVSGGTLRMPYLESGTGGWKQREYSFTVDETKAIREITLIAKNIPVGHGIYEFTAPSPMCAKCHDHPWAKNGAIPPVADLVGLCAPAAKDPLVTLTAGLRLALSIDGKRPTEFGGAGVIVFNLRRANSDEERERLLRYEKSLVEALVAARDARQKADAETKLRVFRAIMELRRAQDEVERAEAEAKAAHTNALVAQMQAEAAEKQLKAARDRLKAAEKAATEAGKPQTAPPANADAVFTVHVRTLTAAEKVIRVKATGKETVLEGLVHAADDVSIKSDAVSVWVVRDKAVLPVDLPAIRNGDAKTNYAIKPGDQLFVQAKPQK